MSLETIFKNIGANIKTNLENRGITVANNSGFKTILLKIFNLIDTKQDTLISGTNIKTINNQSLVGSGDISVSNVNNTYFGTCSTASATASKVVTIDDSNFELRTGTVIGVKFTNSNTASNVTLNVNGTGAKQIWYNTAVYISSANTVCGYANRTNYYMFNGTYWIFLHNGFVDGNTTYYPTISSSLYNELLDEDKGVSNSYKDIWSTNPTRNISYSTWTRGTSNLWIYCETSIISPTDTVIVDFDYIHDSTPVANKTFHFYGTDNSGTEKSSNAITGSTLGLTKSCHITIITNPYGVAYYVDGQHKTWVSYARSVNQYFRFGITNTQNSTLNIKNFTIRKSNNQEISAILDNKADKSTTLSGYGITDAKITNGVITLGNNTIRPLTEGEGGTTYYPDLEGKPQINGVVLNGNKTSSDLSLASATHTHSDKANLESPTFTGTPKAPTATSGTNTTQLATTAFVQTALNNLPSPMVFKGSLGTGGTITSLPTASSSNTGFTYKVITVGTYASQSAKNGDLFISDGSKWVYVPSADEPSGTVTSLTLKANSPITIDNNSAITTSGTRTLSHSTSGVTAGTYGDGSNQTPAFGDTFKSSQVVVNNTGHITEASDHTVKIPNNVATTSTNGLMSSTDKSTLDTVATGLNNKQDVISDLATIRDGANKGETSLQPVGTASQFLKADGSVDNNQYARIITNNEDPNITIQSPTTEGLEGNLGDICKDTTNGKLYVLYKIEVI